MNKKKGFTLIELLAVIIILAIIALIATPIILNVVEDSKLSAGMSESHIILDGINNYCEQEKLKESTNPGYVKKCKKGMTVDEAKELVNLGKTDINKILYNGNKILELELTSNNKKFYMCSNGEFVTNKQECDGIYDIIIKELPFLETTGNGCIRSNEENYSYMGGCYLKGNPTNNSIWYSGFLWRIMGINADGTIKMITDENVSSIPWGSSNTAQDWEGSHAKDWLNTYFFPKLKGNDIIVPQEFCSETVTDTTHLKECSENRKFSSNVGLMTIDEYTLAGGSNSYLNIGQDQWTMTPKDASGAWFVDNFLGDAATNGVFCAKGLRAVINVNSNTTITGGNGSIGEIWNQKIGPYVLNEYKNKEVKGTLVDKTTVGEYVELAEHKYRVVDKTDKGIKLILDGFYEETPGIVFEMSFGLYNIFKLESGIGQKLNDINLDKNVMKWLGFSEKVQKDKLSTEYKWYQAEFKLGDKYDMAFKENNAINENVFVGLPIIGEVLGIQGSSILTKDYTVISSWKNSVPYWTMNTWYANCSGDAGSSAGSSRGFALRPVIVVKSDNIITGGNGTWYNPYKI